MKVSNLFKNNFLLKISTFFVILPIIIFFVGYLRWYIALPSVILILVCAYKVTENENIKLPKKIKNKKNTIYLLISLIVIAIWLFFSGIGNFSYQNFDFNVRNAIFRDLINYKWPVLYSFKALPDTYHKLIAVDSAGLVYYFSYWLPSALVGKLINYNAANIFLYFYTFACLITILYLIRAKTGSNIFKTTMIFILFSGLDILGSIHSILGFDHIEWWSSLTLQFSANTTQLYWVFNQSIMIWLIVALMINFKKPSSILFIACMCFCYSPFATFGIIPIAIYLMLNKKTKKEKWLSYFKKNMPWLELACAILILFIFGSLYLSGSSSISVRGLAWNKMGISLFKFIPNYLLFIILEVGVYIAILLKKYKNDCFFKLTIIELLIIPFYFMTPSNDFCMRASIAPLFVLTTYVIEFLEDKTLSLRLYRIIMYIVLGVGSFNVAHEIDRSIYYTINYTKSEYLADQSIYSVGSPITEYGVTICNEQFYSKNPNSKLFFKYLAKKQKEEKNE